MNHGDLVLFEDEQAFSFEPASLLRSVSGLRLGAFTHRERWERVVPDRALGILCRGELAELEREAAPAARVIGGGGPAPRDSASLPDTLFVAAAIGRASNDLVRAVQGLPIDRALFVGGRLAAARASGERAQRLLAALAEAAGPDLLRAAIRAAPESPRAGRGSGPAPADLESMGLSVQDWSEGGERTFPATLVDLIAAAPSAIEADFEWISGLAPEPDAAGFPGVHLLRRERVRLGEGVRLDPGVVLDARDGPILVGATTHVMANAVILGPVAIGSGCLVKPGARVAHGVCAGPVCKLGGEIEATILQGYANKQHDGFLGHSYIGAWVNLGAGTDTSDLKNNYGPVRIAIAGRVVDTGSRHVGSLVGDHTKTSIHTMLNTGTVIGAFSNLFGGGFPPKEIPSFAWGGDGRWQEHRFEKALEVASVVLDRRGEHATPALEKLARRLFEATAARRKAWLSQFTLPDARMVAD